MNLLLEYIKSDLDTILSKLIKYEELNTKTHDFRVEFNIMGVDIVIRRYWLDYRNELQEQKIMLLYFPMITNDDLIKCHNILKQHGYYDNSYYFICGQYNEISLHREFMYQKDVYIFDLTDFKLLFG